MYFNFNLLLNLFSKDWYQVINNVFIFWSLAVFLDIPVICFIVLVEGRWGRRPLFAFLLFATGSSPFCQYFYVYIPYFLLTIYFRFFYVLSSLTQKKDQICFFYKEIQNGAVAKSYLRKGFLIDEEMRKYEEAVSHI